MSPAVNVVIVLVLLGIAHIAFWLLYATLQDEQGLLRQKEDDFDRKVEIWLRERDEMLRLHEENDGIPFARDWRRDLELKKEYFGLKWQWQRAIQELPLVPWRRMTARRRIEVIRQDMLEVLRKIVKEDRMATRESLLKVPGSWLRNWSTTREALVAKFDKEHAV